jgi:hypothetical protein
MDHQLIRDQGVQVDFAESVGGDPDARDGVEAALEMRRVILDAVGGLGRQAQDRPQHRHCVAQAVAEPVRRARLIQKATQPFIVRLEPHHASRDIGFLCHSGLLRAKSHEDAFGSNDRRIAHASFTPSSGSVNGVASARQHPRPLEPADRR